MTQIDGDFLLPPCPGLKLTHMQIQHQQLVLTVSSTNPVAFCPVCQTSSRRVHCNYTRTIADLCCMDLQVRLQLHVRRFVCSNTRCARRTFAERLGEQIKAYARRTRRSASQLQTIGLMLGGNAGVRLAKRMGLSVSADTLLRLVRATEMSERPTPDVLGVDDFALRKGVKYGTILVDLERHHLVDLLPDREKATTAAWLKAHPGVKMISRDRGGAYAEAAREAAPNAIQIADRFHLSQNVGETVVRIMRRNYPQVKEIFETVPQGTEPIDQSLPLQRHEADKQVSQQRRMAIYEHVIALYEQGSSQTEIAAQLHMSRKSVRACMKGPPEPPVYKQRSTKLAPYKAYLQQRFAEDEQSNSLLLYREMCARGYDGCCSVVTSYVTQLRQQAGVTAGTGVHQSTQPKPLKVDLAAPSQIRWWFVLPVERLTVKQQAQLLQLRQGEGAFSLIYQLVQAFIALLHQQTDQGLTAWLEQAQKSSVAELVSFAKGILRDEAAVRAGLSLNWSQGQVEGAVNRLKLIKRSMYGRAKFDLLRIRVLYAA
jgi:transposase